VKEFFHLIHSTLSDGFFLKPLSRIKTWQKYSYNTLHKCACEYW